MFIYLSYTLLVIWLAICTFIDAKTRKIPNWLIALLFIYSIYHLLVYQQTLLGYHWLDAAVAFIIALLLSLPGYIKNQFGAGDVKLLLSIALATSTQMLLYTIAGTAISLILWSIGQGMLKKYGKEPLSYAENKPILPNSSTLPYAPFVLAGFISGSICIKLCL